MVPRAENYPLIPSEDGRGFIALGCRGGHPANPRLLKCECGRTEHTCGDRVDGGLISSGSNCRKKAG
jgi:hypothetical protein